MELPCRRCKKTIPAEDINIQQMVAKCAACGALFSFGSVDTQTSAPAKPIAAKSDRIEMKHEGGKLVLSRRWFEVIYVFLLFFALIWTGIAFGFLSIFTFSNDTASDNRIFDWIFTLFPLIPVAAGLVMLYIALAGIINRTIITVDNVALSIRHFPLPWRHSGAIASGNIEQLYCREYQIQNRGQTWNRYDLCALLRSGIERKLLKGIDTAEDALYLEREIENHLGITDRPVAGEYKG